MKEKPNTMKPNTMKKVSEIPYMEINLLQKESGKFKKYNVDIPFGVTRSKAQISDTDRDYLVLRYTPSELSQNERQWDRVDENGVKEMKKLIKSKYGLNFIKLLKGSFHQPLNAENRYDGNIDYYLVFGNKELNNGGNINEFIYGIGGL